MGYSVNTASHSIDPYCFWYLNLHWTDEYCEINTIKRIQITFEQIWHLDFVFDIYIPIEWMNQIMKSLVLRGLK